MKLFIAAILTIVPLGAAVGQAPPALRVSPLPGAQGIEWVSVSAMAVSRSGVVAVADATDRQVVLFPVGARPPMRIGRKGEGPGEFESIAVVGWHTDSLWVRDQRKLSLFSPSGQFIRQIPIPSPQLVLPGREPERLLGGDVLALGADNQMLELVTTRGQALVVGTVGPSGLLNRAALSIEPPKCPGQGVPGAVRMPFCTKPLVSASASGRWIASVVLASRAAGRVAMSVTVTDEAGTVRWAQKLDFAEVPISRQYADSIRGVMAGYQGTPPELAAKIRAAEMSTFFPPVTDVLVGPDGEVWLRVQIAPNAFVWQRHDGTGRVIGRASVSPRLELHAVAGTTAWGVMRDADDVPQVVRAVWP
jgi:hypothetical protein